MKKKKEVKTIPELKKTQQRPATPAKAETGTRSAPPKKPLFSKELLIKLLPLIKAFALWFVLVLIVHIPGIKDEFRNIFVGFTTTSTYLMAKIFFIPMEKISFSTLSLSGFNMEIIVECTAYNFYLFAIALAVFGNWSSFV